MKFQVPIQSAHGTGASQCIIEESDEVQKLESIHSPVLAWQEAYSERLQTLQVNEKQPVHHFMSGLNRTEEAVQVPFYYMCAELLQHSGFSLRQKSVENLRSASINSYSWLRYTDSLLYKIPIYFYYRMINRELHQFAWSYLCTLY